MGNLEDIHRVLPELLNDFENIQNSQLTALQASRAIAKSFQEKLDLYYAIVLKVEDDFAVFDTFFGSQASGFREEIEYFWAHTPHPREIPKHIIFSKVVSSKTLLLTTLQTQSDPTFSSALLPSGSSWVWLPIIKQGKVISLIELGSETIIRLQEYWNDEDVYNALRLAFETLQLKINRVLEDTRD